MLVGICGGSCSGKTTLVKELQIRLFDKISVVSFDDYFLGKEKLDYKKITDWESPALYDYKKFIEDLNKLREGKEVRFASHSRESSELGVKERVIFPKALTVVEGFLIFHHPVARSLFDKKIYIDLPEEEIIKRRISRRKNNSHWDSPTYIKNMLIPGHRRYVLPQKKFADLILDGREPIRSLVKKIEKELGKIWDGNCGKI